MKFLGLFAICLLMGCAFSQTTESPKSANVSVATTSAPRSARAVHDKQTTVSPKIVTTVASKPKKFVQEQHATTVSPKSLEQKETTVVPSPKKLAVKPTQTTVSPKKLAVKPTQTTVSPKASAIKETTVVPSSKQKRAVEEKAKLTTVSPKSSEEETTKSPK